MVDGGMLGFVTIVNMSNTYKKTQTSIDSFFILTYYRQEDQLLLEDIS